MTTPDLDPLMKRVLRPMIWTIIALITSGILITLIQAIANRTVSLLLALACILLGSFVGFLFGIPRVLQVGGNSSNTQSSNTSTNSSNAQSTNTSKEPVAYQQQVNTNLEQISDWLTKIIVGLGLVNLYKIPDLLRDTSELIAQGIALPKNVAVATIFANAIILYFPVLGFLFGYLITRIFLSGVFRVADMGQLIIGGQEVGLADVVKNLVNVVTDAKAPNSFENVSSGIQLPKRILWVDDNPNNNSVEREILSKSGIEVITALTTDEALKQIITSKFDLIISDMARNENGTYNSSAGVYFLKQMQAYNLPHIRTLIYCSKQGAELYGAQAKQSGADEVLNGPQALMKAIGIN